MQNGKSLHLSDLTMQDLQLEIIRRSRHNLLNGEQVVRDLLAHRDWWIAVIFDNDSLIKLRDLHDNFWNVDTLYVLATNVYTAQQLVELAEESWHAEEPMIYSTDATQRDLGDSGADVCRIVRLWWD